MWQRFGMVLALTVALIGGGTASAAPFLLSVDPTQSWVAIGTDSTVTVELPPPFGERVMSVASQAGALPGVAGATIGDGTLSDGLRTSLSGELLLDETATTLEILSERSLLEPATSGTWLPGLPGSEATAAAAQVAILFEDPAAGLVGSAALRDVVIGLRAQPATLTDLGGGAWSVGPATFLFRFPAGALDYDLGLDGSEDRTPIDPTVSTFQQNAFGTLEDLGGGRRRLTLPIDLQLALNQFQLATPVPTSMTLHLTGQIVAETVPEPGAALLVAGALAWTGLRSRSRPKETRG